jgi:hypothetical protein
MSYRERYSLTKRTIDDYNEIGSVQIDFEAIMLDDVVRELDKFLKASGFCYKGELQIVRDDENV